MTNKQTGTAAGRRSGGQEQGQEQDQAQADDVHPDDYGTTRDPVTVDAERAARAAVPDRPESAADRRARERTELAARLRELDAQDQAEGVNQTPPDKRLTLAGGDVVETSGAVPTHHYDDDGNLRRVVDFEPID
jgi:hypothetical protein